MSGLIIFTFVGVAYPGDLALHGVDTATEPLCGVPSTLEASQMTRTVNDYWTCTAHQIHGLAQIWHRSAACKGEGDNSSH